MKVKDCSTKIVLACSHSHSLQLPCTVGGNQARSDARSEFEIFERSPKGGRKLVVHRAVQGGNMNCSDAPPASMVRKIT